ncbi:hypothetical protein SAMN05216179_1933 [Gracilibacillus kekensis]|uniref:Calcineurin-like phosphoesterase domain-containing protein n=2 Tax=Gracilibacillus kekensis TaxID=1027249 RepID=A0A1M7P2P5_9BACI|nr:hypothetical protein SAMN05216179_1933 [Gracilibacillus kekensis]
MLWIALISIILFSIIIKSYYDTHFVKIERLDITTGKLEENQSFTILQMTDLHNKQFNKGNQRLIDKIQSLDPDVIAITGDLIDRKTEDVEKALSFVEKIVEINPDTYFVSGNHEWGNPLHDVLFKGLEERKVRHLDNQNTKLEVGEIRFQLAGIGDPSTNHDSIEKALAGLDNNFFTVLLSHAPDVKEMPFPTPIDLTLSGHTHGGQISLPLVGSLIAPDQGLFPKYDKGLYQLNDKQQLYIDSGLGTSVIDARLFNQSQMTFITVKGEG